MAFTVRTSAVLFTKSVLNIVLYMKYDVIFKMFKVFLEDSKELLLYKKARIFVLPSHEIQYRKKAMQLQKYFVTNGFRK